MPKGIFALLIMLLAVPALTRANQESEPSENTIVIETSGHSDQESLTRILSEAGIELDGDMLEALQGGGAKIKIIKHSRSDDDDADPASNKKVFVTRSKHSDHRLMPADASLDIDQLDVEVIATGDKDILFIRGMGAPFEHAERLFEEIHEAPVRGPGGMHWFEDDRDEHRKQNLTGDAAQCVIKNLTKVTSPMAAKLLREACISLHEE